jgi:hypothetical protein
MSITLYSSPGGGLRNDDSYIPTVLPPGRMNGSKSNNSNALSKRRIPVSTFEQNLSSSIDDCDRIAVDGRRRY